MTAHFGMKRLLFAILPWMVVTAAYGQNRTAQVIYTYHEPLKEAVYRVADECYAPVFSVEQWGWKVQLNRDDADISAEGKKVSVPIRTVGGRQAIPLRLALQKLGADLQWDDTTDTLAANGLVNAIKISDAKIEITTSLPVKANIFTMIDPPRVVVDIQGAKLLEDAILEIPKNARMKQFKPDVVRIVLETPNAQKITAATTDPSASLTLTLDGSAPTVDAKPVEPPAGEDPDHTNPDEQAASPTQEPPPVPALPVEVLVNLESSRSLLVLARNLGELTGPVQFRKPDPKTLDVILPGAHVKLPDDFKLKSASIVNTLVVEGEGMTTIRFTLARAMGAQVTSENGEVVIQLSKPNVGNGKLAGKVIVVDPGHGGHDTGAHSGKLYEKNLTLAIATKVAGELADAGATVIMTRKTDVFIPLLERADIANRNEADFFISVHINSNTLANSMSGSITFHHKGSEDGKLLAECIQDELAKVNKLPNLGAWSDGKIYQNGFSVLRNTQMPGVLLELGFINHSRDRARVQTKEFRDALATAVVKGLQDYLGDGK
ncbi:MAG: N-acetylmuramoyl-L-alanine amidase [Fimbriimonadaceae bacterium]|jgi:N-acetylmuramoyl-L-alanine amidase|nr:N-acetylmuramoyl-L-alanine amidase [Fimbriimonadaceae bacterium]